MSDIDLSCGSEDKLPIRVYTGRGDFFYLTREHYGPFHKVYTKAVANNAAAVVYGRTVMTMAQAKELMKTAREYYGAPNDPVGFLPLD